MSRASVRRASPLSQFIIFVRGWFHWQDAVNQLAAFGTEVQALIEGGVLSVEHGQPLIDEANSIIDQILAGG